MPQNLIDKNKLTNPKAPIIVDYKKNGNIYKRLFLYTVYIDDISEIGLTSEMIPTSNLQAEEIDWCGFMSKTEAERRIFHRVSHLLDLVKV